MAPRNGQRFVLLVDDEEIVIRSFGNVLAAHPNYLLDVALTVADGVAKLNLFSYHVVILDLKFDNDVHAGLAVLRELNRLIRKSQHEWRGVLTTRVIIMSSHIDLGLLQNEAPHVVPLEFIPKPVSFDEAFVERVLRRIGLNEGTRNE